MRLAALPALVLAAVLMTAAGSGARWQKLPDAPEAARTTTSSVAVWTGKEMIVFGRTQSHPPWSVDAAAAYDPATASWRALHPFPGPRGNFEGKYHAVWTGRLMLVVGPFDDQSYDPQTGRWRKLPQPAMSHPFGVVAWTGRELVSWGGGCCGDASDDGVAFDPATNRWRKLAPSPLAPSNGPQGAWDGRELVVLVSGFDPDGNPYPARLARAAAYDPQTNTWRRIAAPPAARSGAVGVWDGERVFFVGGSPTRYGGPAARRSALPTTPPGTPGRGCRRRRSPTGSPRSARADGCSRGAACRRTARSTCPRRADGSPCRVHRCAVGRFPRSCGPAACSSSGAGSTPATAPPSHSDYRVCGKPRSTFEVAGSGQREVTTFERV